ncbi:hypothetical protein Taro_044018 [Colocasia esculenta]|uniref:Protein kinase domain-containing protein n=1 Tax=Colocasia esculenta TaxID=4460 RepID=A0A843X1V5_COLES|nr:hypothetical protein [Colocasia esculenta]
MVFFEGTKRFELEDLLRASAEMLGKGGYGTTYKAVLEDGGAVAVKRLRDLAGGGGGEHSSSSLGRREFEQHMEALGRLRHPNLVSLRACYSARDEKLLVYDFMPNGSLFSLLHGNRGPGRTPLDWATRVRVAAGAARGIAYLHQACRSSPKLSHGNLKSTNVLLDKSGAARIADFGLASLAGGAAAAAGGPSRTNGYRAPELTADPRKAVTSHKADVYAFGVLLLELLTGKHPSPCGPENGGAAGGGTAVDLPRWVQSVVREEWTAEVFDLELMRFKDVEEEMVGMLQIATSCTAASPDQRPKMANVVKMIDELRGADGSASPSQDSLDSVSDSPSASDDASACRNRQW